MRETFLVIALLLLQFAAAGQDAPKVIIWSPSDHCGFNRGVDLASEKVKCSSVETKRGQVSVIEHDGLVLAIVLSADNRNIVLSVSIGNSASDALNFDSDNWAAAHYRSAAELQNGKPPMFAEYSIPSRDLVRGMTNQAAKTNSLDSYIETIHLLPDTIGDRGRSTTASDDDPAIAKRAEARSALTLEQQELIRKNALTAKFVLPNGKVKGLVYFRAERKAPYSIISMPIGDTIYVIEYLRDSK